MCGRIELVVYLLRTTPADLLRCRFAQSQLWELGGAIRTVGDPAGRRWHLPWLAGLTDLPAGFGLLRAMQTTRGYTPDFLAPIPTGPGTGTTVEAEVARVAATPLPQVLHEVARCRPDQHDPALGALLDDLLARPAQAVDRITEALLTCWEALLAPHWPRVSALLDADVAHHARLLADQGLVGLIDALHPDVRWVDGVVQVRWQRRSVEDSRDLDGAGLVLLPSAFTWPHALAVLDPPWQPTVVYPARGVGELWAAGPAVVPDALSGVLGPTRARLLADLDEPASTTVLAGRYDMAPSTLSRHLGLLAAAGLVAARRARRQVLYRRTPLGTALCTAAE